MIYIESYDQRKGTGVYKTPDGKEVAFCYRDFVDEQMVPAGSMAELRGGKIGPIRVETSRFRAWLRGLFRRS